MIAGILLAAGRSARFGGDKLLHRLPDGTPLGLRAALNLRAALGRGYAVVARREAPLADLLERAGLSLVACGGAERGMGASIACGVSAAAEADGYVIALADMPYIEPATVRSIAEALAQGAVCAAPVHRGRRGHPVGFSRALRDELLALAGEQGARAVLERAADRARFIEVEDAGVLRDVDRIDDLDSAGPG